jgi:hypothetical protein
MVSFMTYYGVCNKAATGGAGNAYPLEYKRPLLFSQVLVEFVLFI